MKASDFVAGYLRSQGVSHVFEVVGGMITHLIDSIAARGDIQLVSMHHEQAAAFAAEGVARMTGVPGVAMATSGPGATNLLTGIGSCYFDSYPAVFITGQVNRHELKGDRGVRQLGFQETDIVSMARPITKAAWLVGSPEALPSLLAEAFRVSLAGRPGPVLLDIPMDVQRAEVIGEFPAQMDAPPAAPDAALVAELLEALWKAKRPLILAGGGVRSGRAAREFRELAAVLGVPVVSSLMAVDALEAGNPLRVGMIGSYGNRWANLAIGLADFLLVLGSRLDIRQTGSEVEAFGAGRTIFHVDCDPTEVNNRVQNCTEIHADLSAFLVTAAAQARGVEPKRWPGWSDEIAQLRLRWPDVNESRGGNGVNPNEFMHQLSAASGSAAAFVVDVGQHQMWAGQSLAPGPEQRFLTSGGLGAMGSALPIAVGAAFASAGRPVVLVAGDGGFQVNLQELQTVVANSLPIKILVLNNGCYGMVRQFQESYFGGRYHSTVWGYSAPDFVRVAQAFGIEAIRATSPREVPGGLAALWKDPGAPFLLEVAIDTHANAFPKIAFGRPITEMEPFAKPVEMEGT